MLEETKQLELELVGRPASIIPGHHQLYMHNAQ
jgi:hypothetical protein